MYYVRLSLEGDVCLPLMTFPEMVQCEAHTGHTNADRWASHALTGQLSHCTICQSLESEPSSPPQQSEMLLGGQSPPHCKAVKGTAAANRANIVVAPWRSVGRLRVVCHQTASLPALSKIAGLGIGTQVLQQLLLVHCAGQIQDVNVPGLSRYTSQRKVIAPLVKGIGQALCLSEVLVRCDPLL